MGTWAQSTTRSGASSVLVDNELPDPVTLESICAVHAHRMVITAPN